MHPPPRTRRSYHHSRVEFSDDSSDDYLEMDNSEESDGEDPTVGFIENQNRIKWEFQNETWSNPKFMYQPMPRVFSRSRWGPSHNYCSISTFLNLFELLWTPVILGAIVDETN